MVYITNNVRRISSLKELTADEQKTLIKVYIQAFLGEPYCELFSEDEVKEIFHSFTAKVGDLYVIYLNNSIVGLGAGYTKANQIYWLEELAIDPQVQGRGLGKSLLKAIIYYVQHRLHSCEGIELKTTIANVKSRSLYEGLGFVKVGNSVLACNKRASGLFASDERVFYRLLFNGELTMNTNQQPNKLERLVVAYPNGNPTALIFDQDVLRHRKLINDQVIAQSAHNVEQVGFIIPASNFNAIARLEMAGGEFCGNAARSAVYALTKGQPSQGLIEVSGTDKLLEFIMHETGEVTVEMPLPTSQDLLVKVVEDGTIVNLDGISHLVVTKADLLPDPKNGEEVKTLAMSLLEKYNLTNLAASGVSFYYPDNTSQYGVYVKAVNTLFPETACGSGTCAIGIAKAYTMQESLKSAVIQPSGEEIAVNVEMKNDGIRTSITGTVSILFDDEFSL